MIAINNDLHTVKAEPEPSAAPAAPVADAAASAGDKDAKDKEAKS